MSALSNRIFGLQGASDDAPSSVPTLPKDGKDYRAVREIPLSRVVINRIGMTYDDTWLLTADGAPVPPTGDQTWGQLYAAGRS
jgi:hypothetical protein